MTLLFLLDLVFRHLSRILSKGLPPAVVPEFFGLNLAWIVATVASLAVLTVTLMAFRRLAADHEITAMQTSSVSLLRQVLPACLAVATLAAGLIWFNNNQLVEIHKKYAITAACLVFVLVGAPLRVLARRGGLSTGVGLSLVLFLLYWACLIGGENSADRQIVSPFTAMWPANFFIGGFGGSVFRRMATGNFTPRSSRAQSWFSRFSLRRLLGLFRRRRKMYDESVHRLNRYQPIDVEARVLNWDTDDQNNDGVVVPPPPVEAAQPAAGVALPQDERVPTLSASQLAFTPVAEILRQFTRQIRANLVLLADRNGLPLAHDAPPKSKLPSAADLEMMAKLAAGQIAATREITRTIDEDDDHIESIFHEGRSLSTFIYPISENYILIVLVNKSVVIGLVRLHASETVGNLRKVLEMI